jgi:hypothetical protein
MTDEEMFMTAVGIVVNLSALFLIHRTGERIIQVILPLAQLLMKLAVPILLCSAGYQLWLNF